MPAEPHDLLHPAIRAKWINTVDEHAEERAQTLLTRSRDVIQMWARQRAAEPATGKGTFQGLDGGSGLRLDFPGMTQSEMLSWTDWFREFEQHNLVFAFREQRDDGQMSQDYRIITPDQLEVAGQRPPTRNDPP